MSATARTTAAAATIRAINRFMSLSFAPGAPTDWPEI
jgi:hypothetical protein